MWTHISPRQRLRCLFVSYRKFQSFPVLFWGPIIKHTMFQFYLDVGAAQDAAGNI